MSSFFDVTGPKKLLTSADFQKTIEKAALKTASLTKGDLESTTRTWQRKPKFTVETSETSDSYVVVAGTDDDIFGYVDQGTGPHVIRPRRSPYLRFMVGGRPKTRPGVIGSESGAPGNAWRSAFFVLHPGVAKRDFTGKIRSRRQKTIEQEVSQGVAKLLRSVE